MSETSDYYAPPKSNQATNIPLNAIGSLYNWKKKVSLGLSTLIKIVPCLVS